MIEWDTVAISAILSGLIGLGVALYVRFFIKPTHEKVFESNRNQNLEIIFNQLEYYDSHLQTIFDILEEDFGEITRDRKKVVLPSMVAIEYGSDGKPKNEELPLEEFQRRRVLELKFEETKKDLENMIATMKEFSTFFNNDYSIYHNYIHDSFLRDVRQYFWDGNYFVDGIQNNAVMAFLLGKRSTLAEKMIAYLESSSSTKMSYAMNEFVKRWTERWG